MVAGPPRPLARSGRGRVLPPGLAQAPPQAARPRALDAHPALHRRRRARPRRPRLAARRDRGGVPPVGPHAPARADRRPRHRAHARRRPRAARALLPPARPPRHRSRASASCGGRSRSSCGPRSPSRCGLRPSSPGTSRRSTRRRSDSPAIHRLEHLSFVVVGLLVWTLIIDPAHHLRLTVNERIGVAVLLFWIGQVLSYVFVFGFEPLLRRLRRAAGAPARPLPPHRPAARRRRDDGRADADARRRPRAALPERPSRQAGGAAPRRARRVTPSPWSFSFEPLYLVLAAVALALYVRAWRPSPRHAWRAVVVRRRAAARGRRAQLAARDDRRPTTSSSSTCSRT